MKNSVFGNRNFRLVFLGALVSELGALLYSFAVSFYILQISDNNAFLQGLYLALCAAALMIFTPIGGVLGDRFNKAKIMYICDYIKGGTILLATVCMLLEAKTGNFCPVTRFLTIAPFLVREINSLRSGLPATARMLERSISRDVKIVSNR